MFFIVLFFVFSLVNCVRMTNEFVEQPEDIQSVIGSRIILRCRTEPLHPNEVTWCKNDFCTLGKTRDLPFYPRYEIIGDAQQGKHHFQIVNVSLEDMGMYQCQIRAGQRRAASMSRKAKLTVLQIPISLSIDNPIRLQENVSSFVVCRASNAMPEAKLTWHLPSSLNYFSKNDYVLLSSQSLRNSISNLTFFPSRSFHGQLIQCQAHSTALDMTNQTMITEQYIQIIFPPQIHLNIRGKQIEDQLISIDCHVHCRPDLEEIQWFNGSSRFDLGNSSRLTIRLTRSMHRNEIFCQAKDSLATRNQSVTLQLIYRPRFVDIYGNFLSNSSVVLVDEGQSIELQCFVDSSPPALLSWIFNGQILERNRTSLKIEQIRSSRDLGSYICSAFHSRFGSFNRTIQVVLKGPPEIVEQTTSKSVSEQQSVLFLYSISTHLPIEDVFWSREGQAKLISNEKYSISETRSEHLIQSKFFIKNVFSSDEGFYVCTAINSYGSSLTQFHLRVLSFTNLFFQRSFFYGSIIFALLFIVFLLICLTRTSLEQRRRQRTRRKSSTTDETISSLVKQPKHLEDQSNTNVHQHLFHEQFITHDISHSIHEHFFDFDDEKKRFSTVV